MPNLRISRRSRLKSAPALVVFSRLPTPGKAKTRLMPLLGAQGAAGFQAALLSDALARLEVFKAEASRYLFLTGCGPLEVAGCTVFRQRGAGLGERLESAFRKLLRHHSSVVVTGTDSPTLAPSTLRVALDELRFSDAVLGPCADGGYYLIGLRRFEHGMLRGVRWGSSHAFGDTLRRLIAKGFGCSLLEPLEDVDLPADFRRLSKLLSRRVATRRRCPAVWRFISAGRAARPASSLTALAQSSLRPALPRRRRTPPPGWA